MDTGAGWCAARIRGRRNKEVCGVKVMADEAASTRMHEASELVPGLDGRSEEVRRRLVSATFARSEGRSNSVIKHGSRD